MWIVLRYGRVNLKNSLHVYYIPPDQSFVHHIEINGIENN